MKKKIALILAVIFVLCLFSGCGSNTAETEVDQKASQIAEPTEPDNTPTEADSTEENTDLLLSQADSEMFTDRDMRTSYDEGSAITIELQGSTASASSDSVKISGSTVQITEEATYRISGTLDEGMLLVNAPDTAKIQLVFDNVDITSASSAALYILEADKVFITLAEGSENYLANGGIFTAIDENDIDAALFSKQDLTINGGGSLTVISPAGHGIVAKDDLVLTGGTINVSSASHGLNANDSVRIINSALKISAGKDGIHSDNSNDSSLGYIYISSGTINIESQGDGISASSHVNILGGDFNITAGGGSANGEKQSSDNWGQFMDRGRGKPGRGDFGAELMPETSPSEEASSSIKGINADAEILISGGTFTINSADDAVHSNTSLNIYGGSYDIATGDDAFHAEDSLNVNAGTINISESYEGLEALHVQVNGGDINIVADDDGINAAGGMDNSGFTGGRDGMFGGRHGGMPGGGMMSGNSDGSVLISGGNIYIKASGDGIDANGTLEISGGYIIVSGPSQGDTIVLDYDVSASIIGGCFIGTGGSMMAQTFSSSTQGLVSLSVGTQESGTEIYLTDGNGNTVIQHKPELSYQIVILSSPDIISGQSYTITVGSQSSEVQAK